MNGYNLNKDRVEVIGVVDPYKSLKMNSKYSIKNSYHLLMIYLMIAP